MLQILDNTYIAFAYIAVVIIHTFVNVMMKQ